MKRATRPLIGSFFFLFLLPLLSYGQTAKPEFRLDLHYKDAGGGGSSNPVALGYDSAATDGLDPQFGESWYPTASSNPGGYYLAFQLPGDTIASLIDIMHKPATDTFTIQYKVFLSAFMYPATLSWDPTQIPSAVKGLIITPAGAPFLKMADMTKQSSVTIDFSNPTDTNYYTNWEAAYITLYYNTPTPFAGVGSNPVQAGGLLSNLITYPDPMMSSGWVTFTLSEPASVIVSGYDALGQEAFHIAKNEPAGENQIDLSGLIATQGAVMVRVEASSGTRLDTKTVMLVKE